MSKQRGLRQGGDVMLVYWYIPILAWVVVSFRVREPWRLPAVAVTMLLGVKILAALFLYALRITAFA